LGVTNYQKLCNLVTFQDLISAFNKHKIVTAEDMQTVTHTLVYTVQDWIVMKGFTVMFLQHVYNVNCIIYFIGFKIKIRSYLYMVPRHFEHH